MPELIIVAGPPGSGKSTSFPLSRFNCPAFNVDDRAAQIWGSYQGIPLSVRDQAKVDMESFVDTQIRRNQSFAFETTLRSGKTFRFAEAARTHGFDTHLVYVALDNPTMNIDRVRGRALMGGHSAPEAVVSSTYDSSLRNLPEALRSMNSVAVFDNTTTPTHVLDVTLGMVQYVADDSPHWLERALWGTEFELSRVRDQIDLSPLP